MPHVTRQSQRSQARYMRDTGEQVILLVNPNPPDDSAATPFDPTISNEAIDVSTATQVPIYAKIKWHDLGELKFQEGGRTIFRKADIETTSQWSSYLFECFAVLMEDGSILRKESQNLSETQAIYTITVSGYIQVPQ